jgi:hypothetical protein
MFVGLNLANDDSNAEFVDLLGKKIKYNNEEKKDLDENNSRKKSKN